MTVNRAIKCVIELNTLAKYSVFQPEVRESQGILLCKVCRFKYYNSDLCKDKCSEMDQKFLKAG